MSKDKYARILVFNDFHPAESFGAASMAYQTASRLTSRFQVIFCSTFRSKLNPDPVHSDIIFTSLRQSRFDDFIDNIRNKANILDLFFRFGSPYYLFVSFTRLLRTRPTLVWVHQIGHRFPYLLIFLTRLLRIPVVITSHDFTALNFRKLYPLDFFNTLDQADQELKSALSHYSSSDLTPFLLANRLMRSLVRFIYNSANEIVYLSNLQQQIYVANGFQKGLVIPNVVSKCDCVKESRYLDEFKYHILFAGRFIGKGLQRIVKAVQKQSDVHLHLAGGEELASYTKQFLSLSDFTYHGKLTAKNLYLLIHQVNLISVVSDCFDVYPTIALESLAHGKPFITTAATGVAPMANALHAALVVELNGDINLDEIRSKIGMANFDKKLTFTSDIVTQGNSELLIETFCSVLKSNHNGRD